MSCCLESGLECDYKWAKGTFSVDASVIKLDCEKDKTGLWLWPHICITLLKLTELYT